MLARPEKAARIHAFAAEIGSPCGERLVSAVEASELHPMLRAETLGQCFYEPDAQSIDVDLLMTLYRKRALALGCEIVLKAPVTGLLWRQDAWVIQAGDQEFQATSLVNAAGGWAGQVGALAGAQTQGLVAKRRSAGIVPMPDIAGLSDAPMAIEIDEEYYFKPSFNGLIVSPADQTPVQPHDAYADDTLLAQACWDIEQISYLKVERMLSTWGGLRTFAPDGLPVIKRDAQAPNFIWSAGQGGYGIQAAPAWAKAVRALLSLKG